MARKRIGEILLEDGYLQPAQLTAALAQQARTGGRLGRILVDAKVISEQTVVACLAQQHGVPVARFVDDVPAAVLALVPAAQAERDGIFPLGVQSDAKGGQLSLAMVDPTHIEVIDQLQFRTGKRVIPMIASETEMQTAIRRHYYGERPRAVVAAQSPVQFAGTEVVLEDPSEGAVELTEAVDDEIPLVTGVLRPPTAAVPAPPLDALPRVATAELPPIVGEVLLDDAVAEPESELLLTAVPEAALLTGAPAAVGPARAQEPVGREGTPVARSTPDMAHPAAITSSTVIPESPPMAQPDALKNAPFCPDCGATKVQGSKFCGICGCSFTGQSRAKGAPAGARAPHVAAPHVALSFEDYARLEGLVWTQARPQTSSAGAAARRDDRAERARGARGHAAARAVAHERGRAR